MSETLRIAILGSGPIGLEAALAAADAGLPFTLYEAGPRAASSMRRWGHVRLFTPWAMNVSPRMARHLEKAGHEVPAGDGCPTGAELADRVLEPLARSLGDSLRRGTRVVAVGREGLLKHEAIGAPERAQKPFRLLLRAEDGSESLARADRVLDCTGTYEHPNTLGASGVPALGEEALDKRALGDAIHRHIPDVAAEPELWGGKTTLLVGAGHSAQTAVCELAELAGSVPGTRILWAFRGGAGLVPIAEDPLPGRAELTAAAGELARGASPAVEAIAGVGVRAIAREGEGFRVELEGPEGVREVEVDNVLSLTGYVGDHGLYRQLQVHECYATSGPMKLAAALLGSGSGDCLAQTSHGADALRNPEPGFFILGSKSYGRNNTFLMRTGWEQVEEIFSLIEAERQPTAV